LGMTTSDWRVLHFCEFCPEEQKVCDHQLMLTGLEDVFDLYEQKCKIQWEWRKKESGTYAIDRIRYHCVICLQRINANDHPIGVINIQIFRKATKTGKDGKICFVLHDLCLSYISMDKKAILPAVEKLLADTDNIPTINKYGMFKGSKECTLCFNLSNERIYNCSDMFCRRSYHLDCTEKDKERATLDFHGRT
ncbi:hypothetical protein PFISCL1PPCAC_23199, partial [Pristionchus fissidentatus]